MFYLFVFGKVRTAESHTSQQDTVCTPSPSLTLRTCEAQAAKKAHTDEDLLRKRATGAELPARTGCFNTEDVKTTRTPRYNITELSRENDDVVAEQDEEPYTVIGDTSDQENDTVLEVAQAEESDQSITDVPKPHAEEFESLPSLYESELLILQATDARQHAASEYEAQASTVHAAVPRRAPVNQRRMKDTRDKVQHGRINTPKKAPRCRATHRIRHKSAALKDFLEGQSEKKSEITWYSVEKREKLGQDRGESTENFGTAALQANIENHDTMVQGYVGMQAIELRYDGEASFAHVSYGSTVEAGSVVNSKEEACGNIVVQGMVDNDSTLSSSFSPPSWTDDWSADTDVIMGEVQEGDDINDGSDFSDLPSDYPPPSWVGDDEVEDGDQMEGICYTDVEATCEENLLPKLALFTDGMTSAGTFTSPTSTAVDEMDSSPDGTVWDSEPEGMEVEKWTASWVVNVVDEMQGEVSDRQDITMSDVESTVPAVNGMMGGMMERPDIILADAEPVVPNVPSTWPMVDSSSLPLAHECCQRDLAESVEWTPKIHLNIDAANVVATTGYTEKVDQCNFDTSVPVDSCSMLESHKRDDLANEADPAPLDKGKGRAKEPETIFVIPDDKDGKPTPGPSTLQVSSRTEELQAQIIDVEEATQRGMHPVDEYQLQSGRYARMEAEVAQENYDDSEASNSEEDKDGSQASNRPSNSAICHSRSRNHPSGTAGRSERAGAPSPSPERPSSKRTKKQDKEEEVTSYLRNEFGRDGLYRQYLREWKRDGLFANEDDPTEEQLAQLQRWRDRAEELNRRLARLDSDAKVRARVASDYGAPGTVGRKWLEWFERLPKPKEFPPCVIALAAWAKTICIRWNEISARLRKERVLKYREKRRGLREARETANDADNEEEEEEQEEEEEGEEGEEEEEEEGEEEEDDNDDSDDDEEAAEELQHSGVERQQDEDDDEGDGEGASNLGFDLSSIGDSLPEVPLRKQR